VSLRGGNARSFAARPYASIVESGEKLTPWKLPEAIVRVAFVATSISSRRSGPGGSPTLTAIVFESGDQAGWLMFASAASVVIGPPAVATRSSAGLPLAGSEENRTDAPSGEISGCRPTPGASSWRCPAPLSSATQIDGDFNRFFSYAIVAPAGAGTRASVRAAAS